MSRRLSTIEKGRNVSIYRHRPKKRVMKFTDQYPFAEQQPSQRLPVHVVFLAAPQVPSVEGVIPVRHVPATEKACWL